MKQTLVETQKDFESSTGHTPEYLAWHRLFKREFTEFLTDRGGRYIQIGKPNHFDVSGFFTVNNVMWYFRIEDLRWSKDSMLIRTAQSYKDYTGGRNQYISLTMGDVQFSEEFSRICLTY